MLFLTCLANLTLKISSDKNPMTFPNISNYCISVYHWEGFWSPQPDSFLLQFKSIISQPISIAMENSVLLPLCMGFSTFFENSFCTLF